MTLELGQGAFKVRLWEGTGGEGATQRKAPMCELQVHMGNSPEASMAEAWRGDQGPAREPAWKTGVGLGQSCLLSLRVYSEGIEET